MELMEPARIPGKRLHGLDTLRAHMMLLGVLFHAALNYTHAPVNPSWPMHDSESSAGLSVLVSLISIFRMPLFFMMAGFFFCLLQERRGLRHALADRVQRILLPLMLFLPIMFAACGYGFHVGMAATPLTDASDVDFDWMQLYHLWFLYFLAFYYALSALWVRARERWWFFAGHTTPAQQIMSALGWWALFSLLMWIGAPMNLGASITFLPNLDALMYYGFFFALGYWLYRHLPVLHWLETHFWRVLGLALVFIVITIATLSLMKASLQSLALWQWLLVSAAQLGSFLTIVAGYLRWVKKPSTWGSYFSQASYWVYLIHLPLVIWLCNALAPLQIDAWIKFLINSTITLSLSLTSYHFLVRTTWLGWLLNGKAPARPAVFSHPAH